MPIHIYKNGIFSDEIGLNLTQNILKSVF